MLHYTLVYENFGLLDIVYLNLGHQIGSGKSEFRTILDTEFFQISFFSPIVDIFV